ncbi:MAG: hypothetical protein LBD06_08355 [Candidatus Accumulibacter sp.]|nr:hypothetical protein [Accumulibacter sp.]
MSLRRFAPDEERKTKHSVSLSSETSVLCPPNLSARFPLPHPARSAASSSVFCPLYPLSSVTYPP